MEKVAHRSAVIDWMSLIPKQVLLPAFGFSEDFCELRFVAAISAAEC
ncbi:hypothetical protein QG37_03575 [Candidozyma auris]|uniref:Uncharacterized protein n=1 Tax=Candidozyma auris TaxID=498019 RepID=A0A0L0P0F3_CANAR|nr:hypothetical protein QG37_03575 [[Candida] auris]